MSTGCHHTKFFWLVPLVFKLFSSVFYIDNHIVGGDKKDKFTIAFAIAIPIIFLSHFIIWAETVIFSMSKEMPMAPSGREGKLAGRALRKQESSFHWFSSLGL